MAADQYTRVMGDIQALFRSRLQIQILLALQEGDKTLSDLRDKTGSSSQAIIPKIRGLESQMLVEQRNYEYILTPLGQVLSDRIIDFVSTIGAIRRHKDFWATHDLTGIPAPSLSQVGKLVNSEIVFDTTEDVIHVYTMYLKIVKEASRIYGASSVMSPGLAESLSERVFDGIPVELVVNADAGEKLGHEPYLTDIRNLLSYNNFRIWITRIPLRVGLTVTDRCISLGLYKKDGKIYDSSSDLFSVHPDAIKWGEDLFRYFRDESDPLTF